MADHIRQTGGFHPLKGRGVLVPCAVVLCISAGLVSAGPADAQGNAPCMQIKEACTQAGFKAGAAKDGNGLVVDCIQPIMQGVPQRAKATTPLPQIDAKLIADCKAANPSFGQRKTGGAQTTREPLAAQSGNVTAATPPRTEDVQRQSAR
jgi:hypothetical protein